MIVKVRQTLIHILINSQTDQIIEFFMLNSTGQFENFSCAFCSKLELWLSLLSLGLSNISPDLNIECDYIKSQQSLTWKDPEQAWVTAASDMKTVQANDFKSKLFPPLL